MTSGVWTQYTNDHQFNSTFVQFVHLPYDFRVNFVQLHFGKTVYCLLSGFSDKMICCQVQAI